MPCLMHMTMLKKAARFQTKSNNELGVEIILQDLIASKMGK